MNQNTKRKIPTSVFPEESGTSSLSRDLVNLSVAELIERYAFAEAVVETVREPLVVLDPGLKVKSANKAFFDTFKMAEEETIGKLIFDLNGREWDVPELKRLLEDILPQNSHFNDYVVRHDFSRLGKKTMLLNARRVVLEENKTQLILLAIEDVTEKLKIQEQKDMLLGMASHELKTPITTIKSYAQLLGKRLAKSGDDKGATYIASILSGVDKLIALINDYLEFDKIEAGKLTLKKTKINLKELIGSILEDFRNTVKSHAFILEGKATKKVPADKDLVTQVITNLIDNAVSYSPEGKKVIVRIKNGDKEVVVSVQDFGSGIPKSKQKMLFNKYSRIEDSHTIKAKGHGLGLYISAQIVEKHGGRIWVESKKGEGSTFCFSLPVS